MQKYTRGLHILCSFHATADKLASVDPCRVFFHTVIEELGLVKVGEAYHSFDNGGFTGVICLTESHISIHTWPEFELATFDVFLSNFKNDNTGKVRSFHRRTLEFFNASEIER